MPRKQTNGHAAGDQVPTPENLEEIPPIPSELVIPVRCLAIAASKFRDGFKSMPFEFAKGADRAAFAEMVGGFDAIIDKWLDHPDLEIEGFEE